MRSEYSVPPIDLPPLIPHVAYPFSLGMSEVSFFMVTEIEIGFSFPPPSQPCVLMGHLSSPSRGYLAPYPLEGFSVSSRKSHSQTIGAPEASAASRSPDFFPSVSESFYERKARPTVVFRPAPPEDTVDGSNLLDVSTLTPLSSWLPFRELVQPLLPFPFRTLPLVTCDSWPWFRFLRGLNS